MLTAKAILVMIAINVQSQQIETFHYEQASLDQCRASIAEIIKVDVPPNYLVVFDCVSIDGLGEGV